MSSAPLQLGALSASVISTLQGELITTAIQFFLHGIYTTLVAIVLYHMWTRKTTLPARNALIATVFFMFACSNIQVIEQVAYTIVQVFDLGLHPPPGDALLVRNIRLSENVFGRFNYFLSDAIVVWRAWALWQDNLRVKIILSVCIFFSFAGVTTDMTVIGLYLFGNQKFLPTGPKRLALILPLMITNIVATVLFGIKAWVYRTHIKGLLNIPKARRTHVERILSLLTESGAIYCLIWIPQLYIYLSSTDPNNLGYKIVANMLPQLSAIYPVVIVLLVALEKTQLSDLRTTDGPITQPINFVHATPAPSTSTGTLRFTDPKMMSVDEGKGDKSF
ncbi:hypothetical protein B0H16DRAFT_1558734 [Mycena metata]|uniref:Uncharacterized protein n=1 Tax=Mycena metata TaxID=1033252 RepID=A0AAD7HVJ3_9AGAR|nr:hypothetical protein B0H16DRAFT_1589524 [Mycena metata]KAJ7745079.1 hypothetical protein B0H16DRAFT_1558734 [Mycena metata]